MIVLGAILILSSGGSPAAPTTVSRPTTAPIAPGDIPEPDIRRVSVGDSKAALDLKQAVLLDVRATDSYQAGHIPGAKSIPLGELEARLNELNRTDWIITYCT